ncbi:hypothetical protein BBO99_00004103 [Phytophthora kernoviae]|uniref:Uncharacterized protein n=2 Tax=Phytophthora kernoviae TaxID=325452 RepID=A0A3R7HJI7_9STRA|nr:hypothetical protein G195_004742 [Phytophthora kernoviae 00238/432]KAG2526389.1 hypothetical protein JM16_003849 [Phytophthora kernoviae]KAG2527913.1 hypothetical protein JM18_003480 [Phytophthora kernoviae]RLM96919.1 hypothetical protein BBI17_004269 [Phytophthora kernoviae]RLN80991.1 hypothetical protein BBO99_00004103 [Phytophthora kernoviae]
MMFVDPWEVEAEGNVRRYMYHSLHVELGWDRLSPICSETSQLWNADSTEQNRASMEALEKLLPSVFSGPPAILQCTVYQKNKVLNHQFMGSAKTSLDSLTSGNPMDCWLPLEDTTSGSLHVRISLSFQLMCSSMGSIG